MTENKFEFLKLAQLKKLHNKKYPNVVSHEPTSHGISIRFKSTFICEFDESKNDWIVRLKEVSFLLFFFLLVSIVILYWVIVLEQI